MKIELPWPHRALHPNARVYWAKKAKIAAEAKAYAHWVTVACKPGPLKPGKLMFCLEFVPPDRRKRDDDGLIASMKSARDGIAQALGIDDNRFITRAEISDDVCKGGKVVVTIESAEALKAMGVDHG